MESIGPGRYREIPAMMSSKPVSYTHLDVYKRQDFGYNSSGVQAAAQAYFGCDVGDLTVAECATLASIPRSPAKYSPLKTYYNEDVSADSDDILLVGDTYTIVYNDACLLYTSRCV